MNDFSINRRFYDKSKQICINTLNEIIKTTLQNPHLWYRLVESNSLQFNKNTNDEKIL